MPDKLEGRVGALYVFNKNYSQVYSVLKSNLAKLIFNVMQILFYVNKNYGDNSPIFAYIGKRFYVT